MNRSSNSLGVLPTASLPVMRSRSSTSGADSAVLAAFCSFATISRDVLNVNAGSLYPALYRLEERGQIKAAWTQTNAGRNAKVYSVTAAGRRRLADQRDTWERFAAALSAILKTT